ncbi:MAG TPA: type II toxin-antitoxin system VapB family antitoxin [Longimicrobium sp.]|jgi:antitoxin VapB|nr:type II toxin-antitoxin system VapB family antitoxin [Longimicrobium sp.]
MALNIKHPEADRLARALAQTTGESLTVAVLTALKERLQRESGRGDRDAVRNEIQRIQRHFASGRIKDPPSPDEIIGYDEHGLPV